MPGQTRAKCDSSIYHILVRGINRQDIFHDEEDCRRYLEIIGRMKNDNRFELYGYCLMTSHIHLLIVTTQVQSSGVHGSTDQD